MQDLENNLEEIWKSLKGVVVFGDYYEVSNLGNVRSVDRKVNSISGGRTVKGQMLKLHTDKDGYLGVKLYISRKYKSYRVHRLVAFAFIPNPENKPLVNHKDGLKDNNVLSNLEWATESENQRHAFETGLKKGIKGENNVNSKLTDEKILKIVELYKTDTYSMQELANMFDSSLSVISNVINGKAWAHLNVEKHKRTNFIITDELVKAVKEMHEKGYSKRKIERESGVSRTTVTKILDNY